MRYLNIYWSLGVEVLTGYALMFKFAIAVIIREFKTTSIAYCYVWVICKAVRFWCITVVFVGFVSHF